MLSFVVKSFLKNYQTMQAVRHNISQTDHWHWNSVSRPCDVLRLTEYGMLWCAGKWSCCETKVHKGAVYQETWLSRTYLCAGNCKVSHICCEYAYEYAFVLHFKAVLLHSITGLEHYRSFCHVDCVSMSITVMQLLSLPRCCLHECLNEAVILCTFSS